jgi:hypothetical protein
MKRRCRGSATAWQGGKPWIKPRTEELEAFFSRSMHFTLDPWESMFGASEEA